MKILFTTTNALLILLIIIILGTATSLMLPLLQQNQTLATSAKPEPFTELYFENHLSLTKSTALNTPETFSFTIHNLEYKTMEYPYEIFVQDVTGSRSAIVTNSITLKHDQKKTITESYQLLESLKRAKVVVRLLNKNQEIHFWIGEDMK